MKKHNCPTCHKSAKHSIIHELKHHAPFTFVATLLAVLLVLIFKNLNFHDLFEIAHPLHILVSAMATTAVYYIYSKKPIRAIFIGVIGAILIGTISDVIFPWLGGLLFGINIPLHLPIIEEPFIILLASFIGVALGMTTKTSKEPHAIHVFLSVFASLFYLLSYSGTFAIWKFLLIVLLVFIAVLIPCCISDIVFPLWFIKNKK